MKKYASLLLLTCTMQSEIKADGWWQDLKTKVKNTFDKDKSSKATQPRDKSPEEKIYELQQENLKLEAKVVTLEQQKLRKAYELQQLQTELTMLQKHIEANKQKIQQILHPTPTHEYIPSHATTMPSKPLPIHDPKPQPKDTLGHSYLDKDGKERSYPVKIHKSLPSVTRTNTSHKPLVRQQP